MSKLRVDREIMSVLWQMLRPARAIVFLAVVVGCILAVVPYAQIIATERLVDAVASSAVNVSSPRWLFPLVLLLGTIGLAQIVFAIEPLLDGEMRERIRIGVLHQFWAKIVRLPLTAFEEPQKLDTMYRAFAAAEGAHVIGTSLLQGIISGVGGNMLVLTAFWKAHPVVALIMASTILPIALISLRASRRLGEAVYGYTSLERKRLYWMDLGLNPYAGAEIRLYSLGSYIKGRWLTLSRERVMEQARIELDASKLVVIGTTFFVTLPAAVVLLILLWLTLHHQITLGTLVALANALAQYRSSVAELSWRFVMLSEHLSYVQSFAHLMRYDEEPADDEFEVTFSRELRFDKVTFKYPGSDTPALHQIDLVIHPGERVAIIGENGSGKTTLIKLLAGLYRPTSGKISVDGRDITEIPPQAWRKHLSVVFQDFMRYAFTVRQNITISNPCNHQDNEQLQKVIRQAGLQEVVDGLPNGSDTLLGREFEGGCDLSMGQWQRVALARALFRRDAAIFVLDEPTAWQDAFEEFEVYRHFEQWAEDQKAVVLISHRIAPALVADRIILMQHGQIIEQGSHDELMRLGGRYALLYQTQSQQYDMRSYPGGRPVT